MKTFDMNVSNKKQLIDLNGDSVNFDVNFKLTSQSPFYMVVVNQSTLDENKPIEYKHVTNGEISGNIVSDSGNYDNYFIIIKSDNPAVVQVTLDKKEVPLLPTTKADVHHPPDVNTNNDTYIQRSYNPQQYYDNQQIVQTPPKPREHQQESWWSRWKYTIIIVVIIGLVAGGSYYYYKTRVKPIKSPSGTEIKSTRKQRRRLRKLLLNSNSNDSSTGPKKQISDLDKLLVSSPVANSQSTVPPTIPVSESLNTQSIVPSPPTVTGTSTNISENTQNIIPPPSSPKISFNLPSDISDVSDV